MRLLAVSTWWPFPANNGARMRIASLLNALATHHEVHLVALSQDAVSAEQLRAAQHVCASATEVRERVWIPGQFEQLASLWHNEPASVRATWNPAFDSLVRTRAREIKPDAVVAFQVKAAPYACSVPDVPRILEELEITNILDAYRASHGYQQARAWLTWAKLQSYTRSLLRSFSACTVVSQREHDFVRRLAPASMPLAVIPNGAEIDHEPAVIEPQPDTLIYPGALSYSANLDAMCYFLAEIYPSIRAARPNVRLRITGHTTPEQRAALPTCDGVDFTGYVDNIRHTVARSWCEVVPLREGGGTRLKILEALAVGTPVVATSKGAEGLELVTGRDLMIADHAESFINTTIRLLGDPDQRALLAAAGQRAVRQRYDWRIIGAQLVELVEQAVRSRGHVREPVNT